MLNSFTFSPHSSLIEDGVVLLRKRKDFSQEVILLEFKSEKDVNEGELTKQREN